MRRRWFATERVGDGFIASAPFRLEATFALTGCRIIGQVES